MKDFKGCMNKVLILMNTKFERLKNMSLMIDEAWQVTRDYLEVDDGSVNEIIFSELEKITECSLKKTVTQKMTKNSTYEEVQCILSKINEKESIRKSKGVYYTPSDVVNFIVRNTLKLAEGKLTNDSIKNTSIDELDYKRICFEKVIYDPTCGAGEFLLAALEMKFELYERNVNIISKEEILNIVSTVQGNDINKESTVITKLRLFLCAFHRYGTEYISGLADTLNIGFETIDFVTFDFNKHKKYDIIVGNPPYVEDSKSGLVLEEKYGNIYANVLLNACKLLNNDGVMGFIIPLSYVSTPRMRKLREKLKQELDEQWILNYADRPDCLFSSVHQKLSILIARKDGVNGINTGNYQYWYKEERGQLFSDVNVIKNNLANERYIPKIGNELDYGIYKKIQRISNDSIKSIISSGDHKVYLNMRAAFWIKAFLRYHSGSEYKTLEFENEETRNYVSCILNSSLYWWFWICISDCWHITQKELCDFKLSKAYDSTLINKLAIELEEKLEDTKEYVGTKQVDYEYKHKLCVEQIHKIDDYINELYGLTKDESDYIKEFAFRYRVGGGPA